MKIAYCSHYFTPEIGAPSARIYDLSRQWLKQGHEVQVLTCYPNHPTGKIYPGYTPGLYQQETLDGITVHRNWTYVTPNKGFFKKSLGHLSYLPSALALSAPRMERPDAVIGTSPTFFVATAAAAIGASRRIPFIMEVRDLWPAVFVDLGVLKNPRLIRVLEQWELWLYRRATRIVTVTHSFRRNLVERGIPAEKVAVIPNGADVEFWQPRDGAAAKDRLGLRGRFVVLYIGAHGIAHALARILESAEVLREHRDILFLFVGEGAEKEMLVRRAGELGLENVRFLDPVGKEEVREFYAAADICLLPLRDIPLFDTFLPSKMFEMMAMARPILASVRGEAAEILDEAGCARVVPPEDSRAIAGKVLELKNDPASRRELGESGRRFVVERYSRRALAEAYATVITEAVAEHGGSR